VNPGERVRAGDSLAGAAMLLRPCACTWALYALAACLSSGLVAFTMPLGVFEGAEGLLGPVLSATWLLLLLVRALNATPDPVAPTTGS
jgi:hypothetical protein